MKSAFVSGATGLLGNNLVRLLVDRGVKVTALVRSSEKAKRQFGALPITWVQGDMADVQAFAHRLAGHDALFHTAAYFRDSYKGGAHRAGLIKVNVEGTGRLFEAAYAAGVRRMVHTSSVAVLDGPPGELIDETMDRRLEDADDYYLSKILSERRVRAFMAKHPDAFVSFVLPGWMFGPGDAGPTSAGQTILDFAHRRLPGVPPGSFSIVDARDVALAEIAAAEHGKPGERYLCAGHHLTMENLFTLLSYLTGVDRPTRKLPLGLLYVVGGAQELWARLSGRPALLSLASVRLLARENGRSHYDSSKTAKELGVTSRPVIETLDDTIGWYYRNAMLPNL